MYSATQLNHGNVKFLIYRLDLSYGHNRKMFIPRFNLAYPCSYSLAPSHRVLFSSISVARRQGSTNSDEHARPKKKKTTAKKKKRAPSTSPSAFGPDDADYIGEEEDDSCHDRIFGIKFPRKRPLCSPAPGLLLANEAPTWYRNSKQKYIICSTRPFWPMSTT